MITDPVVANITIGGEIYLELTIGTQGVLALTVSIKKPAAIRAFHVLMLTQQGWSHRAGGDFKCLHHKIADSKSQGDGYGYGFNIFA